MSDLTRGAGVVLTSKDNLRLKHIEFVRLEPEKALAVLVSEDGSVENRIIDTPAGMPTSALVEAGNYLNARVRGRNLAEARADIEAARRAAQNELDSLAARLVDAGLASWAGAEEARQQLIVRGQANLLGDLRAKDDLERIRLLFADLETKTDVIDLLHRAESGDGVKIFIGSENKLFSLSGSSMIAAPLRDGDQKIAGVLGVIGPTRLNYARIVPMVEYTARVARRSHARALRHRPRSNRRDDQAQSAKSRQRWGESIMSNTTPATPEVHSLGGAIHRLQAKWGAIVAFGVLLIVLGVAATMFALEATIATVTINGVVFLIAGAAEIGIGMHAQGWGRFFLWVLGRHPLSLRRLRSAFSIRFSLPRR